MIGTKRREHDRTERFESIPKNETTFLSIPLDRRPRRQRQILNQPIQQPSRPLLQPRSLQRPLPTIQTRRFRQPSTHYQ